MPPKDKYTDPELRDQVKEEIKESDKGGAPGQWSARKAQMMAKEYKNRGGDYNQGKDQKDESQQNLSNWGDEEWQTKEGNGKAKKEDGTEKRYLPKKAWEQMSEKEREETDQKKQEESKEGKQHVENTDKAKESRKNASKSSEGKQSKGNKSNGKKSKEQDDDDAAQDEEDDEEFQDGGEAEQGQDGENDEGEDEEAQDDDDQEDDAEEVKAGQKRKGEQSNGSSKKQKDNSGRGKSNGTVGSKHMDAQEPGKQGSKDRLPKEGQQIHWKAMPGWVDGEVTEILKKDKTVDGKSVKASEDDPKIVLKSNKSGKVCVHKPDACYYD
ncbi:hypothetical protein AC578_427 [Pseudocercospora eumusae]|uniref:Hypervirulence associated protein TUDOR domain-containing protein n=1 Tax=Pseudocercospora eumusae TaxID=321146 RepID=A0A139HY83_9PEZI|nr:hypothetical protein AC578_427 [Pseudocercospora eumusae]